MAPHHGGVLVGREKRTRGKKGNRGIGKRVNGEATGTGTGTGKENWFQTPGSSLFPFFPFPLFPLLSVAPTQTTLTICLPRVSPPDQPMNARGVRCSSC